MKIFKDFLVREVLWYKIGGKARFLLEVQDEDDLLRTADFLEKNQIKKVQVIGLGSNLLFSDKYFDGAVIRIVNKNNPDIKILKDGEVEVFAGTVFDNLINFAFDHNLIGLEWAGGLPGTVGAGVRGNVGAFGGEMKDNFLNCEVFALDNNLDFKQISRAEMDFGYRTSKIKKAKNLLIASSTFRLKKVTNKELAAAKKQYLQNIDYRKTHHPVSFPTCGSVFKNITKKKEIEKILQILPELKEKVEKNWHEKVSMAYLISYLGLKGFQIGQARVSSDHANFILNLGGAKFIDVFGIIKTIKESFFRKFGFLPTEEVEIVE